jgi:ADP-heptose:LPS heptosyltransferase
MQVHDYQVSRKFLQLSQIIWRLPVLQHLRILYYGIDSVLCRTIKRPLPTKAPNCKKQVLVIYNLAIGDCVMFLGVADSLRQLFPENEYSISIACQAAVKSLFTGVFDRVIPLDFSGALTNVRKRRELFQELNDTYYDVVIDPVGSDAATMNVFAVRATTAKEKIGVVNTTLKHIQLPKSIRNQVYDRVVEIDVPGLHLIEEYAFFLRALGCKDCIAHPADLPSVELALDIPDEFFVVFPAASLGVKRWPAERFAEIARRLQEKTGLPLLLCGTAHDRGAIDEMVSSIPEVVVFDCVGKTSVIEFQEIIGRAKYVITNDTSVFHIATARQVDTFLACGGYTFNRYARYHYSSLGYKDPHLVYHEMPCFNCGNYCKYPGQPVFPCIENISVEDMWEVISEVVDHE